MKATVDRRAGTQSRRGSTAKQRSRATQATGVRQFHLTLAGAIPLMVRDTPNGWGAPRASIQKRGHVALPMDTCGDTLLLGHLDWLAATLPSQAPAGAAEEAPDRGQWEGQDVPLVRPSPCIVKRGIPSSQRYLPTYLLTEERSPMHAEYPDGAEVPGSFVCSSKGRPKQWVWFRGTVK